MVTLLSSISTLTLSCLPTARRAASALSPSICAAVGAEHDDGLARVGHRHAVAERPHVPEPAGAELHARREPLLRMARQALVVLAIVQQLLRRHRAVEHAQQILRRHAMAGLVVEHRHDRRAVGDEGADDHHFRHGVVRAAGVAGQALGAGQRGEEHDRVAAS